MCNLVTNNPKPFTQVSCRPTAASRSPHLMCCTRSSLSTYFLLFTTYNPLSTSESPLQALQAPIQWLGLPKTREETLTVTARDVNQHTRNFRIKHLLSPINLHCNSIAPPRISVSLSPEQGRYHPIKERIKSSAEGSVRGSSSATARVRKQRRVRDRIGQIDADQRAEIIESATTNISRKTLTPSTSLSQPDHEWPRCRDSHDSRREWISFETEKRVDPTAWTPFIDARFSAVRKIRSNCGPRTRGVFALPVSA